MRLTVVSPVAKDFILEAMARAEAMLDNQMHWIKKNPGKHKDTMVYSPMCSPMLPPESPRQDETDELLKTTIPMGQIDYNSIQKSISAVSLHSMPTLSFPNSPFVSQPGTPEASFHGRRFLIRQQQPAKYLVKNRKFEVNVLCRVFLGKLAVRGYTLFICLYIYCTLWAYTCVFSSAMSKVAPFFSNDESFNYTCYSLVFATIVVPMSCLELSEQIVVQVFMTGCRFVMLFLMLTTSGVVARDMEMMNEAKFVEPAPLFEPSGIPRMLPICAFGVIYHHSIPGLSHPVADKRRLGSVFKATTVFSVCAYALLGAVIGLTLGQGVEQSSNLNWNHFRGGTGTLIDGKLKGVAWWAKAIGLYVVCFPALDVVSAFPLNAITLGNNMLGAAYGRKVHEAEVSYHKPSTALMFSAAGTLLTTLGLCVQLLSAPARQMG